MEQAGDPGAVGAGRVVNAREPGVVAGVVAGVMAGGVALAAAVADITTIAALLHRPAESPCCRSGRREAGLGRV